jgi:hypothetical protein
LKNHFSKKFRGKNVLKFAQSGHPGENYSLILAPKVLPKSRE